MPQVLRNTRALMLNGFVLDELPGPLVVAAALQTRSGSGSVFFDPGAAFSYVEACRSKVQSQQPLTSASGFALMPATLIALECRHFTDEVFEFNPSIRARICMTLHYWRVPRAEELDAVGGGAARRVGRNPGRRRRRAHDPGAPSAALSPLLDLRN